MNNSCEFCHTHTHTQSRSMQPKFICNIYIISYKIFDNASNADNLLLLSNVNSEGAVLKCHHCVLK